MAVKSAGRSSFSRGKRVLIALNVLLMTVLAFALFAGVCHLASLPAFRTRIDLTRERAFTLSPLTLELLQSMDKEVQVYSFYQRPYGFDPTGRSQVEMEVIAYANRLLEEYVIHSRGMIQVELLDRDRDNLRVEEVHGRIGLGESNSVIFLCDSNRKDLPASDLARIDAGGVDPATNVIQPARILAYNAESALTSALLSVIEERKPKVYFTTGRREASIEDLGPDGIAGAAEILRRANFDVGALKLFSDPRVPEDCAALIVPGPKDDLGEAEVAAIKAYLYRGGRLFLALSPESTVSLDPVLAEFGIGLNRAYTCREPPGLVSGDGSEKTRIFTELFDEESRITKSIAEREQFAFFFRAGAVNRRQGDLNVRDLVRTSEDSWGDVHSPGEEGNYFFDSDTETMGSRVLAVSCEGKDALKDSRMVFFADTNFYTRDGTTRFMRAGSANLPLFVNAVNWLAQREYLLAIPPMTPYESRVDLTEEEYGEIGTFVMGVIPGAAALLGFLVWLLRRR